MRTQEEMRPEIISKAVDDEAFRARLLENPKEAIQEAFGVTISDGLTIEVHEESAMTAHLVLPSSSRLTSDDLNAVVGGIGPWHDEVDGIING